MRTPLVPGASTLRRSVRIVAVAVLGAGLVLTGSSAYACDAPGFRSFEGKQYDGGDEWRGADRDKHGWSREMYDVDKGECPTAEKTQGHRATEHKAAWRGATTVAVKAPRGEVIESYCVETEDGDARVVVLDDDEQVEELTAAYPNRKGGDKKIKRVVVCSKKKGGHTWPSTPTPTPVEETATPEPSADPVVEVPPAEPTATPTPDETPTPSESPSENPSTPSEEPSPTEAPEPSPSASEVALVVAEPQDDGTPTPEAARLAATDEVVEAATDDATEAADRVQDTGRLAFTGAEVTGVFVAAVVLIALGTLAIQASRRRAAAGR